MTRSTEIEIKVLSTDCNYGRLDRQQSPYVLMHTFQPFCQAILFLVSEFLINFRLRLSEITTKKINIED